MSKHSYVVTIPIAGHAVICVHADDEEEAKIIAFDSITSDHIESWEPVEAFTAGNVCYCPHPWELEIVDEGEVDP